MTTFEKIEIVEELNDQLLALLSYEKQIDTMSRTIRDSRFFFSSIAEEYELKFETIKAMHWIKSQRINKLKSNI